MKIFVNTSYDFLGKRRIFYIVSVSVIILGIIALIAKGIPLGIDFVGGTEMRVLFDKEVDVGSVRSAMDNIGLKGMEIKTLGTNQDIILRTPVQGERISDTIKYALRTYTPEYTFSDANVQVDKVGPKIGEELRRDAILAVAFSLIGILVYLAFRFQFLYAVASVVGLFHDILITISAIAIFDFLIPGLRLELNQTMLAAFLTLIGFSVNDTVVVFDRIRENIRLFKNEDIESVMNKSVNATLSRTIITSGTVFLTILVLFIFGGEVLRSFSFTFGIGIITGTYSSVFVSSAFVVDWSRHQSKKVSSKLRARLSTSK